MNKSVKWGIFFGCTVIICTFVIFFGQLRAEKTGAEIYIGSKLYKVIDSIENTQTESFVVKTDYGSNVICYGGGSIWVDEADCSNQVCVKHAKASLVGETIICAPHKLVIKVVGSGDERADAEVE